MASCGRCGGSGEVIPRYRYPDPQGSHVNTHTGLRYGDWVSLAPRICPVCLGLGVRKRKSKRNPKAMPADGLIAFHVQPSARIHTMSMSEIMDVLERKQRHE